MKNKENRIVFLIPYFSHWPEWIDLFVESCKANSSIQWIFFTDCGEPMNNSPNVIFIPTTFTEYKEMVSKRLEINFNPESPYKLCDLKPAYGFLHEDLIKEFDFFGFTDIDVVYGNICNFLDQKTLSHDLITTLSNRVAGHFCLMRNIERMRNAFRRIKDWQALMENPEHLAIDESSFTKIFLRHRKHPLWIRRIYSFFDQYQKHAYFKEQYSTILAPIKWHDGSKQHPTEWYWKKGQLTNNHDGDREFMYLHFMNFKSSRWLPKEHGKHAAWENLQKIVNVSQDEIKLGWKINRKGFWPLLP